MILWMYGLYVLNVISLFEILRISHFGLEGTKLILIVLGLGHCLTFTFEIYLNSGKFLVVYVNSLLETVSGYNRVKNMVPYVIQNNLSL